MTITTIYCLFAIWIVLYIAEKVGLTDRIERWIRRKKIDRAIKN